MIRLNGITKLRRSFQLDQLLRNFATQVVPASASGSASASESLSQQGWNAAMPFSKVPGPTRFAIMKGLLPGGSISSVDMAEMIRHFRKLHGDIFKFPGMFGQPPFLVIFDPKDFEMIYRTEGVWPERQTLDSVKYYRKKMRPEIFEYGGLGIEQGKQWADFRSTVNPVMMQPKTVKLYVPRIDDIASEFIERMKEIRDPTTLELPENFEDELNRWTLEAVGVIALDTRLGLIGKLDKNSKEEEFIKAVKLFFKLLVELDLKPSIWKLVATREFKDMMRAMDVITEFSQHYIEEAKKRFALEAHINDSSKEQSVLEKLVKIDPKIATVMAGDMIMAGVDTTSSALVGTLYNLAKNPDKQATLRNELKSILPEKNSPLTPKNMLNLPYLRACIKESLRTHPVVNGNSRVTGQDLVIKGYQIPKRTSIILSGLAVQTSERVFMKAGSFVPERWLKKEKSEISDQAKNISPFTLLPFGFGPRMCIGRRFAELEIEVLLARIVRNFRVEWCQPDLKFKSLAINVPDGKLQFKISDQDE